MEDKVQPLGEEQLEKLTRLKKLERQQQCWKEVLEVCKKYGCQLVPQIVLTGSKIASQIIVSDKG